MIPDTKDLNALQKAIEALPDGGTLKVPAGEWHTGPLHLKSHMTLEFEAGAVLLFSPVMEDYLPPVFTRWEGVECFNYSPLIYAENACDLTIRGAGRLVGNGHAWWPWKKLQKDAAVRLCAAQSQGIPPEKRVFGTRKDALRPSFLQFISCRNLLLEDFTVEEGPQWTIHPVYCEQVTARRLHVVTTGPNTDGFNPDSCQHVLIEDCDFSTGDDCIAINSGMNEDGWRVGLPCRQVEIRNCRFTGGHAAIAIGSGMSGGVEDIFVHDCTIRGTERGIRLKTIPGRGGYIRNVLFQDMRIDDVLLEAIEISMAYGSSTVMPLSQVLPDIGRITFRRIQGQGAQTGVSLCGLPGSPLHEITLDEVNLPGREPDRREYVIAD